MLDQHVSNPSGFNGSVGRYIEHDTVPGQLQSRHTTRARGRLSRGREGVFGLLSETGQPIQVILRQIPDVTLCTDPDK